MYEGKSVFLNLLILPGLCEFQLEWCLELIQPDVICVAYFIHNFSLKSLCYECMEMF